jgi:hypothetical protein
MICLKLHLPAVIGTCFGARPDSLLLPLSHHLSRAVLNLSHHLSGAVLNLSHHLSGAVLNRLLVLLI